MNIWDKIMNTEHNENPTKKRLSLKKITDLLDSEFFANYSNTEKETTRKLMIQFL
jgi:hypothetical protein